MTTNLDITASHNTYDDVPYESYPYILTSPYHLHTLAVLFGMQPPPVETARILELGCASGGNLIPHAVNYPKAHFVGVDLSKVQIDEANKNKELLGLKNIEFLHKSIMDIDDSAGKFDYIICHGVISWVPKNVQDKIFEISSKNLTENGVVYISYNTLPGWNMVRTIRDMMLYHSGIFNNVNDKIAQSRLLLDFVKDSLENQNSPYSQVLKDEANLLAKQNDHYLRHDHLEEDNTQYYFHEFIENARNNKLQYLSDCNISTMYLGNMPAKVSEKLRDINDIVRTEQYMDFITNRRFRSTLLCHENVKLNRSLNNEDITKFNLIFNVVPEKPLAEVNLNSMEELKFFLHGNRENSMTTFSPYMKAILYSFSENLSNPMSFDKLCLSANKKLDGKKLNEIKAELIANAMKLVFQGVMTITLESPRKFGSLDKPQVSKIILHQVLNTVNMWVTNLRHEVIGISLFERFALRYMDGKHDKQQIIKAVMKHVDAGELVLNRSGQKIDKSDEINTALDELMESVLSKFSVNAFFV